VQILCGKCGRTSRAGDNLAGNAVACPHCGHEIVIPSIGTPQAPRDTRQDQQVDEGFAGQAKREMSRRLVVTCGLCGKNLRASRRTIGRKVRCPSCGKKIRVPMPKEEELPDGIGTRAVGADLQFAGLEADLEEALSVVDLPRAELIRPGLPIWLWLTLAAVLGGIAGAIIWAMAT